MARLKYILLIIVNTIGVLTSIYSLFFTERLNNYFQPDNLICDINKTVSCSTIYLSSYSFVFNLPISLFALLFFWFTLFFIVMNRIKETNAKSYQILSLINGLALISCLYFLYVLIFVLHTLCVSCLLIDAIVIINFLLLLNYFSETMNISIFQLKQLFIESRLFLLSFVLLFFSGFILYQAYLSIVNRKNKELLQVFFIQKPINKTICNNSIHFGNINGDIKIRIFNDFLCGYCKLASERYRKMFINDTSVDLEFICFPLNYNKPKKQNTFDLDLLISKVMLSAYSQKEYWSFHDQIINQSKDLDSTKIFNIATNSLGNFKEFENNYNIMNHDSIFNENIKIANSYKVTGTPTIFINGREFKEWSNINLLKMIISSIKKKDYDH